jgi:hypothetical protein
VPSGGDLKDAFLAQVKASKVFFYNTVVAQAYRVEVTPSAITFEFLPNQRVPRQQCEDMKGFLEDIAQKVAGQKIPVTIATAEGAGPASTTPSPTATPKPTAAPVATDDRVLRDEAMADPSVQALFEIFPVEKSKVEEM